jgi:hypothetical protein
VGEQPEALKRREGSSCHAGEQIRRKVALVASLPKWREKRQTEWGLDSAMWRRGEGGPVQWLAPVTSSGTGPKRVSHRREASGGDGALPVGADE